MKDCSPGITKKSVREVCFTGRTRVMMENRTAASLPQGFHIRQSKSDPLLLSNVSYSHFDYNDIDNINFHKAALLYEWSHQAGFWDPDHCHSVEELGSYTDNGMLTLEELRNHYNSCFTCGVSWSDNHVSLDCAECGGYAMQRPCPTCDGQCCSMWSRDMTASHHSRQAKWNGQCKGAGKFQRGCYNHNDATEIRSIVVSNMKNNL
ncbi:uncharacterized protein LOC143233490 isoform X2 [Tachypleus tridentatus]|uniref:uncharacterized protein LOC143233490 isoform X2 n=1 Tax=Tachypleus tridentatus TaxID=6853 RepID=UPI003FD05384